MRISGWYSRTRRSPASSAARNAPSPVPRASGRLTVCPAPLPPPRSSATPVQVAEEAERCAGVDRRELVDARFGSQEQSKTGGEESRISERGDGTGVPGPRRPSGNEAATSEAIVPHETDAAAHRLAG